MKNEVENAAHPKYRDQYHLHQNGRKVITKN